MLNGPREHHKVEEVFQDKCDLSVVTEICNGGELFNKIVSHGFITENQAVKYLLQMVSAIVYLHSKSIVHMDLKPENVMFETQNEHSNLNLIDFAPPELQQTNENVQRMSNPYYVALI